MFVNVNLPVFPIIEKAAVRGPTFPLAAGAQPAGAVAGGISSCHSTCNKPILGTPVTWNIALPLIHAV